MLWLLFQLVLIHSMLFLRVHYPPHASKCCNRSLVDNHDLFKGNVVDFVENLGTLRGYDPSLDPYGL